MTKIKKDKNNKKYFVFRKKINREVFNEFNDRIKYISNKDKKLKITNEIIKKIEDLKK